MLMPQVESAAAIVCNRFTNAYSSAAADDDDDDDDDDVASDAAGCDDAGCGAIDAATRGAID